MKKIASTNLLFVFLLFLFNGIQAQTPQPKPDQLKLIQQFIGTWQSEIGKDRLYGNRNAAVRQRHH